MLVPIVAEQPRSDEAARHWDRVRPLLDIALELSPERRSAYLDDVCREDVGLRSELESLIGAAERSAWFDRPLPAPRDESATESSAAPGGTFALAQGARLGHYVIQDTLGTGGMGTVYKALDSRLGRPVALKVIAHDSETGGGKRRFFREAQAASALNHPNIVTIYEYDSQQGVEFIAMEYVRGDTLHHLLARGGISLRQSLEWARQMAGALAKAHDAGIVHRDLKPGNVMVTPDGVVKVLDFGIAALMGVERPEDAETRTALTLPGTSLGTPAYMSPEQAKGERADHRSDIFSFGIILYELVAGTRPFRGPDAPSLLFEIAHKDPPRLERHDGQPPVRLIQLIERCLRKEKSQRPQSMVEIAAELSAVLDGVGAPAGKRHRRWLAVAAVCLAGLAGGSAYRWLWPDLPPLAAAPLPRILNCSIEAQQRRAGKPFGEAFPASTRDTFANGSAFRLRFQPQQSGFVYLVSGGAIEAGGRDLWVLYPRPGAKARASVAPGEPVVTEWYLFDDQPGTERLWVVCAQHPVGILERALQSSSQGQILDERRRGEVQSLLATITVAPGQQHSAPDRAIQLRAAGDVLGRMITLRHQ